SQQDLIVGDRRTAAVVGIGRSVLDFLVQSDLFDGGFPGTVASLLFAEPRRLGDQTRAALPGEIAPQPLVLDAKPVLQLGQKEQMNKGPGQPGREPRQSYAARFHDGEILADDGHVALVEVPKRARRLSTADLSRDQSSDIAALLD